MKSILDPNFRYVPSHATDIRSTFARIQAEQDVLKNKKKKEEAKVIVLKPIF